MPRRGGTASPSKAARRSRQVNGSQAAVPLSKEEIVQAALELTELVGLGNLTMRLIADRLGVTAPAMYYHVTSKRALQELVADAIIEQVPLPGPEVGDWVARVRRHTLDFHHAMRRYPGAAAALVRERPSHAQVVRSNYIIQLLESGGLSPDQAIAGFSAIVYLTFGQALTQMTYEQFGQGSAVRDRLLTAAAEEAERLPGIVSLTGVDTEPEALFVRSLDMVLGSLADEVDRGRPSRLRRRR